jgi:hypothetical protein
MHTGSCLCKSVTFEITAELQPPDACHCRLCRKQSGHYWASTDVAEADLSIHGADQLTWYQSSAKVRRGFCKNCGAFLFWDANTKPQIAVAMGAIDPPTGTYIAEHIFVAHKGDYYDLVDDIPQHQG